MDTTVQVTDEHSTTTVTIPELGEPLKKPRRSPSLTVVTDSEMQTWRSCAQKHHFQYRERLRPLVDHKALAVGSIFHTGMKAGLLAGWSDGWRSRPNAHRLKDEIDAAHQDIDALVMKWATKVVEHGSNIDFEKLSSEVDQTAAMVKWMLQHYFTRTQSDLASLVLVQVEAPFNVALHNKAGRIAPYLRYSGVRDVVMYDPDYNQVVLGEHKTSGGNPHDIEKRVEMDTQTAGYLYALKEERPNLATVDGYNLANAYLGRVMYNVLRKALPRSPSINKDGRVSVAACTTTMELYGAAIADQEKRGLAMTEKQAEMLKAVASQGDPFFARVEYHRTPAEIERWRSDTLVDAQRIREATYDPAKRTRNPGNCNMAWSLPCPYRSVCLDPDSPELRTQYRIAHDPHAEVREAEGNTTDEQA